MSLISGFARVLGPFIVWLIFLGLLAISLPARAGSLSLADLVPTGGVSEDAAFGMAEFPSGTFEGLPQWKRVLDDALLRRREFEACQSSGAVCPNVTSKKWKEMVTQTIDMTPIEKIKFINSHFNRWAYISDEANYGVSEYWAIVDEFLSRSGDCEDYAIAKFFALRELGFSNEQLRIFAVLDTVRNIGHAVLVVQLDRKHYVLDIYNEIVTTDDFYKHYTPKYSVNEKQRFLHAPKF